MLKLENGFIFLLLFTITVFSGGGCSNEEPLPVKPAAKKRVIVRMKIHDMSQKVAPSPAAVETRNTDPSDSGEKSRAGISNDLDTVKDEAAVTPANHLDASEETIPPKAASLKVSDDLYIVQESDTLSVIAGRPDVYGDPLKWPSLFRLNMEKLAGIARAVGFENAVLPQDMELKFVNPFDRQENLRKNKKLKWIVNVISEKDTNKITPLALRLMMNGYCVYITRVTVKGSDWMRLRVGFFKNQQMARASLDKIRSLTGVNEAWISRASKSEALEFAGY
jgi:hypothetical protein